MAIVLYMQYLKYLKISLLIWRYRYQQWRDKDNLKYLKSLKIMSMEESIRYIIKTKCSIARYGDGEFLIMGGYSNGFQKQDERLAERLRQILNEPLPNLLVCIPSFIKDVRPFIQNSQLTGLGFNQVYLKSCVIPYVRTTNVYGEALITRFYMVWKNKSHVTKHVELLKKLWDGMDLLIVEGEGSRLGVGNDLFEKAKTINRILCPQENAFDKYDEILNEIKKHSCSRLVILALGMTATVLAYDLAKDGIQALDMGHVDVEYEWFKMKAKNKVPIPNKVMAEVVGGKNVTSLSDRVYLSQIISRV